MVVELSLLKVVIAKQQSIAFNTELKLSLISPLTSRFTFLAQPIESFSFAISPVS